MSMELHIFDLAVDSTLPLIEAPPPPPGGRGCSSEIFNFTPKRDQSRRGRGLCRPQKETGLKYRQIKSTMDFSYNVMINFVYMNRVNIANQNSFFFVISSCATLNETLTAKTNDILPLTP